MKKEWFSAEELAGLPGMPSTAQGVREKAEREGWLCRDVPKSGEEENQKQSAFDGAISSMKKSRRH